MSIYLVETKRMTSAKPKKKLLLATQLITSMCLFLLSPSLYATHIIGGEILYTCLGNEEYEFTMKIYRDCATGIPCFDSSTDCASAITLDGTVTIFDGVEVFRTVLLRQPIITEIEPNISNPCLRPPRGVCVEEGIYTFRIILPTSTNSYVISYQRCCRNETIQNILAPGVTGATYTTEITALAQQTCNSSPVFNDFPPIIICQGVDVNFDHSATDADGDSLVYSLCTPFHGGGVAGETSAPFGAAPDPETAPPYDGVDFLSRFSINNPIAAVPTLKINPQTGLLSGSPSLQGQFVVGICVQAFRNGELMNEVRRDFQFNVGRCDPAVNADIEETELLEENGETIFYVKMCGLEGTLINESTRRGEIFEQDWEIYLPNGTRRSNQWDFENLSFPATGIYEGQLLLNKSSVCRDTGLLRIEVLPGLEADFTYDYDTCEIEPVVFTNLSSSELGPTGIIDWTWDLGNQETSKEWEFEYTYETTGNFPIALSIRDTNNCEDTRVQNVPYFPVPPLLVPAPSAEQACAPSRITFENLSSLINNNYDIFWDFGDGTTRMGLGPTHIYETPGLYTVATIITSPIGCTTDTIWEELINILPSPIADFTFTPTVVSNFAPTVQFTDLSQDAAFINWNFDNQGTSEESMPSFDFIEAGLHPIQLAIQATNGCTDTIIKFVEVLPEIKYTLPNAFTPNEDGKNDLFFGKGNMQDALAFQLRIWNRYGELIFETTDYQEGWNGRKYNRGMPAPNGVYVVVVNYQNFRGEWATIESLVSVIR